MKGNFYIEPRADLFEKIMNRIHREQRILVFKRLGFFSLMFVGSVAGFVPSLKMLLSDISNSGFLNFFSLAFSDSSKILTYWQSFGMILLETLPAISLAIFLAVVLLLIQSIRSLSREVRTIIKLAV